jgi:zinc transport system ATP-binding protein
VTAALEVRGLSAWYARRDLPAVEDVSFRVERGRIAILIGPNGSGKSTLLKAILDLVPNAGEVRVFGRSLSEARREVGYVPQRLDFDRSLPLTVREAIRMPLPARAGPEAEEAFREAVGLTGIAPSLEVPLGSLSGGQLKRALIARALVTRPRLLLLDEPESGVDIAGETTVYEFLDRLVASGELTALICSHELELVSRYGDDVLCLNRRLLCSGPPRDMLTRDTIDRLYGPGTGLYYHHHGRGTPGGPSVG